VLWLLIGEDLLIPHFGSRVFVMVFVPKFPRGLGATDHSHDPGILMAHVKPFWMVLEGKKKVGIGNFGPFFLPSTEKI
jgi:hypothetical protein